MNTEGHVWDNFFKRAAGDSRIGVPHIALFASLCQHWRTIAYPDSLPLDSREIMQLAKISSPRTYYGLLKDLHQYQYLRYEPSFYKKRKSKIYLIR